MSSKCSGVNDRGNQLVLSKEVNAAGAYDHTPHGVAAKLYITYIPQTMEEACREI